jgi:hypothetical protein
MKIRTIEKPHRADLYESSHVIELDWAGLGIKRDQVSGLTGLVFYLSDNELAYTQNERRFKGSHQESSHLCWLSI